MALWFGQFAADRGEAIVRRIHENFPVQQGAKRDLRIALLDDHSLGPDPAEIVPNRIGQDDSGIVRAGNHLLRLAALGGESLRRGNVVQGSHNRGAVSIVLVLVWSGGSIGLPPADPADGEEKDENRPREHERPEEQRMKGLLWPFPLSTMVRVDR